MDTLLSQLSLKDPNTILQELSQERKEAHEKFKEFITLYLQCAFDLDPYLEELKQQITELQNQICVFLNSVNLTQEMDSKKCLYEFLDSRTALDRKWHQCRYDIQAGNIHLNVLFKMCEDLNKAMSNLTSSLIYAYNHFYH